MSSPTIGREAVDAYEAKRKPACLFRVLRGALAGSACGPRSIEASGHSSRASYPL